MALFQVARDWMMITIMKFRGHDLYRCVMCEYLIPWWLDFFICFFPFVLREKDMYYYIEGNDIQVVHYSVIMPHTVNAYAYKLK
jgi:hypothetical protein